MLDTDNPKHIVHRNNRASYTFHYPTGWKVREITDGRIEEIFVINPLSIGKAFSISLSVRASSNERTAEDAAATFTNEFSSAPGFRLLGQAAGTVAGLPATHVEITYLLPLPINAVDARKTVIRERRVFFKRAGELYELIYVAPEEEYSDWLGACRTLVHSFAFL